MMRDDPDCDREWVARLHHGDERAFLELYSAYRARLFSFLLRLGGRWNIAEDLCQEVWMQLAGHPPTLPPGMPLGPWLFRVARNLYISYLRSREYDAMRTSELTAIQLQATSQPDPLETLAGNETERRLQAAVMQLPLAYRECLLLVAGAGLTPRQAAEILDLPAPTLRKRLSRAREALAKRMKLRTRSGGEE